MVPCCTHNNQQQPTEQCFTGTWTPHSEATSSEAKCFTEAKGVASSLASFSLNSMCCGKQISASSWSFFLHMRVTMRPCQFPSRRRFGARLLARKLDFLITIKFVHRRHDLGNALLRQLLRQLLRGESVVVVAFSPHINCFMAFDLCSMVQ